MVDTKSLLTDEIKAAMKRYYNNCAASWKSCASGRPATPWNKEGDLDNLIAALRKHRKYISFEACAGTFWVAWKGGIITVHSKGDYWQGKVFRRKIKGEWKTVGEV